MPPYTDLVSKGQNGLNLNYATLIQSLDFVIASNPIASNTCNGTNNYLILTLSQCLTKQVVFVCQLMQKRRILNWNVTIKYAE